MRARAVRPAIATGAQVDGGDAGALAPCIRYCACLPLWCDQAKRSIADRTHICEHAWGKYGLDECDAL